jgi:hypothetical protein
MNAVAHILSGDGRRMTLLRGNGQQHRRRTEQSGATGNPASWAGKARQHR